MGSLRLGIRRFVYVLIAAACVIVTVHNLDNITLNANGTIYLVGEYTDTYYEKLSDNVGLTTINGISNVFVNMENDGYIIHKCDITESYIDVSFEKKDNPSYRFYFTYPEGRITIFSSEYENSYKGVTYITERKELE